MGRQPNLTAILIIYYYYFIKQIINNIKIKNNYYGFQNNPMDFT